MKRTFRRVLQSAVLLVPLAFSCSDKVANPKGQLMIAISTDMDIPKDVTDIRVWITSTRLGRTETIYDVTYHVGPDGARIPGTFAVVAGDDPAKPVEIRVIGERPTAAPITLRQAITRVPTDRIALLPMPVQWLCTERGVAKVPGDENNPNYRLQSDCPEGETCISGSCRPAQVDPAELKTYRPELVFGGGRGNGNGQCFDVLACFDSPSAVPAVVERASCTITVPQDDHALNIGLRLPADSSGICTPDRSRCFVPLDARSQNGWQLLTTGLPTVDGGVGRPDASLGTGGTSGAEGGTVGPSPADGSASGGAAGAGAGESVACGAELECFGEGSTPPCCLEPGVRCGLDFGSGCEAIAPFSLRPLGSDGTGGSPGVRIQLPPAVCSKLNSGAVIEVLTNTGCATLKSDDTPTCGPWSSVGSGGSATLDGGDVDLLSECIRGCARITAVGAECEAETDPESKEEAVCVQQCELVSEEFAGACSAPWRAYVECIANGAPECTDTGVEISSTTCPEFDSRLNALIGCMTDGGFAFGDASFEASIPPTPFLSCDTPGQDACTACVCTSCDAALDACQTETDCPSIAQCMYNLQCSTFDSCAPCQGLPAGGEAPFVAQAALSCARAACAPQCGAGPLN